MNSDRGYLVVAAEGFLDEEDPLEEVPHRDGMQLLKDEKNTFAHKEALVTRHFKSHRPHIAPLRRMGKRKIPALDSE